MSGRLRRLRAGSALMLHRMHGTRSLGFAALLILTLTLVEPALPRNGLGTALAAAVLMLLIAGLATLAREGIAMSRRLARIVDEPSRTTLLALRLFWPALLVFLLLPRLFLAAYGIPHMSPLTGLVLPSLQRRIALLFLTGVLLVSIAVLRSTRRIAPDVQVLRPTKVEALLERRRSIDALLLALVALVVVWGWWLQPFWRPFTILEWPPSLATLHSGVGGVARIAYTIVPPAILLVAMIADLELLRELGKRDLLGTRWRLASLAGTHAGLVLAAAALHAYDILWIVRYQATAVF